MDLFSTHTLPLLSHLITCYFPHWSSQIICLIFIMVCFSCTKVPSMLAMFNYLALSLMTPNHSLPNVKKATQFPNFLWKVNGLSSAVFIKWSTEYIPDTSSCRSFLHGDWPNNSLLFMLLSSLESPLISVEAVSCGGRPLRRHRHEVFQSQTVTRRPTPGKLLLRRSWWSGIGKERRTAPWSSPPSMCWWGRDKKSSFPHYIPPKSLGTITLSPSTGSYKCAWVRLTVARNLLTLKWRNWNNRWLRPSPRTNLQELVVTTARTDRGTRTYQGDFLAKAYSCI